MILARNEKISSYRSSKKSKFFFNPIDIELIDDIFHGSQAPRFTEWWYFDAVLNNGYSIQFSVRLLSIIKNRFVPVFQRFDVYKNGVLLNHNKIRFPYREFQSSKEKPEIILSGVPVIKGYINKLNNRFVYDIEFTDDNSSANLKFEGITKGWKGKNPGGDWWAVILPRANVSGTITVNGKQIEVKGLGYHDHNWDVRASAARNNHGWFWGKINFPSYTVTWATIFNNNLIGQPLLVVNIKDGDYINLHPEQVDFVGDLLSLDNKKKIPYKFKLRADNKRVNLDISMDVLKTHHVKMMLRMHYWRYHLTCKGSITIDSKKEIVNETQIAEFLRFR
jgi:predicted secreted hydrolase